MLPSLSAAEDDRCHVLPPPVFEFPHSEAGGWLAVTVAILFALTVYHMQNAGSLSFGPFWLRKLLSDYAFALAAVWWSGFTHMCVGSLMSFT